MIQRSWRSASCLLALVHACLGVNNAEALILSTWVDASTPSSVNTSAPADDPGWHNASDFRSGVYLGDQWVLTAEHVPTSDLVLPSGTYSVIPGSEVILSNPTYFDADGDGQHDNFGVNAETLTSESDLKLFRVNTHPTTGLTPEQMDPHVRTIQIATEAPDFGDELVAISRGSIRRVNPNNPNGRWRFNSSYTLANPQADNLNSPNEGFLFQSPDIREKAWGTNELTNPSSMSGVVDNGKNGIVKAPNTNDVVGLFTRFDRGVNNNGQSLGDGGKPDEFQGAAGDSGGPVFYKNDLGDWVLAGVLHAIYALPSQPDFTPMYGQRTAFSDLSQQHYFDQIAALRASDLYSVIGDINLDGQVTGEIINGVPTGDLSALINGWDYTQAEGDIISWKLGDLNQDGVTGIADFALLRNALGGTISMSDLALLIGAPVPEPETGLLAALGALLLGRRARRESSCR